MKKLLYATGNKYKIESMKKRLEGMDIEIISPNELNINIKVNENGKTVTENAMIKAQACYKIAKIPTIAGDTALYIKDFEKQPGTHVRRVNGKELNDDEMIKYYSNLVKEYGGKLTAKWVYGMVIYDGKEPKNIVGVKAISILLTNHVKKEILVIHWTQCQLCQNVINFCRFNRRRQE